MASHTQKSESELQLQNYGKLPNAADMNSCCDIALLAWLIRENPRRTMSIFRSPKRPLNWGFRPHGCKCVAREFHVCVIVRSLYCGDAGCGVEAWELLPMGREMTAEIVVAISNVFARQATEQLFAIPATRAREKAHGNQENHVRAKISYEARRPLFNQFLRILEHAHPMLIHCASSVVDRSPDLRRWGELRRRGFPGQAFE